jgi:hypothetical protein
MQPDCYPLAQSFRNVADPRHFDAGTDSTFHFVVDQDPTFHVMRIRIGLFLYGSGSS